VSQLYLDFEEGRGRAVPPPAGGLGETVTGSGGRQ